jgi:hypothetical protein
MKDFELDIGTSCFRHWIGGKTKRNCPQYGKKALLVTTGNDMDKGRDNR